MLWRGRWSVTPCQAGLTATWTFHASWCVADAWTAEAVLLRNPSDCAGHRADRRFLTPPPARATFELCPAVGAPETKCLSQAGRALVAKVAELADAPDLGSGSRKAVGVQVPPFAPAVRLGTPRSGEQDDAAAAAKAAYASHEDRTHRHQPDPKQLASRSQPRWSTRKSPASRATTAGPRASPGSGPGKAPERVVRQRFRDQILHDVMHELIPRTLGRGAAGAGARAGGDAGHPGRRRSRRASR